MKNINPQPRYNWGLRAAVAAACLAVPATSFASTLAYWTFEGDGTNAVTDGVFIMDTDGRTAPTGEGILVKDMSGNGNSLFTWNNDGSGHQYRTNVPVNLFATEGGQLSNLVPATGDANNFSIRNNGNFPATMTWSARSTPTVDIETIEPLAWTIEASFYQVATATQATFVGRDGNGEAGFADMNRAPLYFQNSSQRLAIRITDVTGQNYNLEDSTDLITLNKWYNVAATSDGTTLRLYKDSGNGYVLVGELALTSADTRLNYDSEGSTTPGDPNWGWTIGRGRWGASTLQIDAHVDRFPGFIDNVRISDVALTPAEFLGSSVKPFVRSGPSPATQVVAVGSPATFTVNAGGDTLTYQWRKDGVNIPGATLANYTIPTTTTASAGDYDVIIANSHGTLTTPVAKLAIHNPRDLTWGGVSAVWDTTSLNWTMDNGSTFIPYFDTDNVRFTALGQAQPLVTFTATQIPSSVLVSGASYTLAGPVNSLGALTLENSASLVLSNASTFAATAVNSGNLSLRATNALGTLSVGSGSAVQLNGNSQVAASLSGSGLISTTNGTPVLTFGANNQNTTWGGSLTNEGGAISFIKVGSGTTTLTGSNYIAGTAASQINGGGLILPAGSAIVPQGSGEFWIAQGANTGRVDVTGGYLGVNNWLVVGRDNAAANGTLVIDSGTVQKSGGGNVVIGSLGATGTLIVNGGQLLNNANIWVGENASANATLRVNNALVQATQIRTAGGTPATSLTYINGGTIQATANSTNFMPSDLSLLISSGGMTFDNNGYDVTINAILAEDYVTPSYGGGFTKTGAGTLTLVGGYTYTGPTVVKGGNLVINSSAGYFFGSPDLVVSNASLTLAGTSPLKAGNVRLGEGAVLNIDFGTVYANPATAPLAATNNLIAPGSTVTINVMGFGLQIGTIPLISYTGTTLPNISNFVLGQLPPGVTATLVNNPNSLDLVVSAMGQTLSWYGDVSDVWNINGAANWLNLGTPGAKYLEYGPIGDPVRFDDNTMRYNVNLTATVRPFTMVVDAGGDYTIAGSGGISGGTAIVKNNGGTLTLTTANSHTGGTRVNGGTLAINNNAALGSPEAALTLSGGNLRLNNGATLAARPVNVTAEANVAVPEGATATLGGTITGNAALRKTDAGTLNVTGSNFHTGAFDVYLGTVNYSGTNVAALGAPAYMGVGNSAGTSTLNLLPGAAISRNEVKLGNVTGARGVVNMTNATLVTGGGEIWIGGSANDINTEGEFNVVNSSVLTSNWTAIGRSFGTGVSKGVLNLIGTSTWTNRGANRFVLASAPNNTGIANVNAGSLLVTPNEMWVGEQGNGILNILGGTVIPARTANPAVAIGQVNGSAGSVRLRSGVFDSADQTVLGRVGGAYGELDQTGGTAISRWYFVVGFNNARAIYRQTGGEFIITNTFMTVAAGGTGAIGVADLSGGTFTSLDAGNGGIYVAERGTGTVNIRGNSKVSITGSATGSGMRIGGGAGASGILNLSGNGVLTANRVIKGNSAAVAVMNFNGGTLKATVNNPNYLGGLNNAYVLAGGATIDDSGFSITIAQPLLAPDANGITSIAVASGGSGYIGAPVLVISGGTGTNGTAVANMIDDGTGRGTYSVGSITVTSPGNYSVDPTTVAFLGGGQNVTAAVAGAITTAANTSGGLTKTGAGTTTLSGANTYTGLTTVSNGTLNVQGSVAGAVLVKAGASLGGSGAIAGVVTVEDTATIGAGTNSIGTMSLAVSPALSANSTVVAELNRNDGVTTLADRINVAGALAYNGRLVLKNAGPLLQPGDKFKLFDATAYSGAFALVSQTFAQTVTWDTSSLAVDGTVTVASVVNVPYTLGATVNGNKLNLSWPADMIGARLMTNAVSLSDTNAWFAYPGSASMTGLEITIDPAKTNVYYRLVYP